MRYINQLELLQTMLQRKPLDSKRLLADVNRQEVIQALKRSKAGLPKPIKVTNAPMEERRRSRLPPRDKERLRDIYRRVQQCPQDVLPELLTLLERHPDVPAVYNYLAIAYASVDQKDKYFETLLETTQRFPDYLFGKTALVEYYLSQHQHRKVPQILDGKFELWQHYPTAEVFHVSEARSFLCAIGSYFAHVNNLGRALYHYFVLTDIGPNHPATKRVGDEIILKAVQNVNRTFFKRRGRRR